MSKLTFTYSFENFISLTEFRLALSYFLEHFKPLILLFFACQVNHSGFRRRYNYVYWKEFLLVVQTESDCKAGLFLQKYVCKLVHQFVVRGFLIFIQVELSRLSKNSVHKSEIRAGCSEVNITLDGDNIFLNLRRKDLIIDI